MISISSDIADLILQNTFTQNSIGLNNSIERMTSGYKINHARDNAANYSITEDLTKKINSMLMIQSNTENGVALLETAQGGLEEMQTLMERLRAIAVQASNEIYDEASRKSLQAEADAICDQISQIKDSMQYNGMSLYETKAADNAHVTRLARAVTVSASSVTSYSTRSVARAAETIEGSVDIAAGATKTVSIDGVNYTVENKSSSQNAFSYSKNISTGVVTLLGSNFEIKAQTNVAHNVIINGSDNIFYGGHLDDIISDTSTGQRNSLQGGNGNDTITINSSILSYASGGDGDDIININSTQTSAYGGAGNDTFNIKGNQNQVYGQTGDDIFNVISGSQNVISGGEGNNTITDNGTNTVKADVPGANAFIESFMANETKTLTIDNKTYTVTNLENKAKEFVCSLSNNQIIFSSKYYKIEAQKDVSHNVILNAIGIHFYGGNLADTIESKTTSNYMYGEGGDDTIIMPSVCLAFGGAGNDTIIAKGLGNIIEGEDGDDNISVTGAYNYVHAGNGSNAITLTAATAKKNVIYGGSGGNNTLIDKSNQTSNIISGFGDKDNASAIIVKAGETKTATIGNKNYKIINTSNLYENVLLYSHNAVTDVTTLAGGCLNIYGTSDSVYKLDVYGKNINVYTGDKNDEVNMYSAYSTVVAAGGNDKINDYGYGNAIYGGTGDDEIYVSDFDSEAKIYGGDGNDTITLDAKLSGYGKVDGGNGDDTYNVNNTLTNLIDSGGNNIYNINCSNASISGGSGNDTFYVTGSNNTILGAGGDDYFVIDGNSNKIDGGTGKNTYVNNGTGTIFSNIDNDPNSGMLTFSSLNEVKTFTLNNKTYTVKNCLSGSNVLNYSFNPNTGVITLSGDSFQIDAAENENAILNLRGSNNVINGSKLADKITVEQGSNNTINGLDGDDILIMNSENNSIIGGNGDDKIILNATTTKKVDGSSGNDVLTINSNNNTDVVAGSGNDTIYVNGTNNEIVAGDGANTVNVKSDSNTITAGNGANKFIIASSSNTITAGNGANTIGVSGDDNIVNVENAKGNINIIGNGNSVSNDIGVNNVIINGNNNNYETISGAKDITIKGNQNSAQGGSGNDQFKITGDENEILGGDGNDTFRVQSGNNNSIDGEAGSKDYLYDNGENTDYQNVLKVVTKPFEVKIKVDIGGGEDKFITTKINFDLLGFDIDLLTPEGARKSLELIDEKIKEIEEQLTNIGSTINRLMSVMEAQTSKINNMISSRSTLRDADIAEESSNMIKYQILQTATGTLMASSRNLRYENVIGLLRRVQG